jgi:hypothetical protein
MALFSQPVLGMAQIPLSKHSGMSSSASRAAEGGHPDCNGKEISTFPRYVQSAARRSSWRKLHRVSQGVAQGMARNNAVKTATYESANNKCSPRLKNESSGMPQLLCQPRIQEDTPSVDLIWFTALG